MEQEKRKTHSSNKIIALRILIMLVVVCSSIGALNTTVSAADISYYVSPTGLDTNPGTQSQPWKTIQKAADTMAAGDTVFVSAGDYPAQRVVISKSGSAGNPITFQAQGTVTQHGGFRLNSADYIDIKGFDITDTLNGSSPLAQDGAGIFVVGKYCDLENNYIHLTVWDGIYLQGTTPDPALSTNCIVRNNRLYEDENAGIEVHGQNHLVEGNEIWGTVQYSPKLVNPPSYVDADGIRYFGSGHVFRKNYIHDILYGPSGINPSVNDYNIDPHIDCFQTFNTDAQHEIASNILFEQNTCINQDVYQAGSVGGKAFQQEGASNNLVFRNNLVEAHGIAQFTDATNLTLVNNTFIGSSNFNGAVGIYLTNVSKATIENNIFAYQENGVGSISPDSASASSLTVGHNCVYRAGGKPWRAADPNDVWNKNPLFVNESTGDYHLQSGSACIDAGITLTNVANDFDGISRPQGNGYDMGAFEYHGVLPTSTPGATATKVNTPIPTSTSIPPQPTGTRQPTSVNTATSIPPQPTGTRQPTSVSTSTPPPPQPTPTRQPTSVKTSTPIPPLATPTKNPSPTSIPSQITLKLNPVADAYISSSYPNNNYGTSKTLDVRNSPVMNSYMRFNVTGLNGKSIKSATLRLLANGGSSVPIYVRGTSDNAWTESGIDYNNKPALGATKVTGPQSYKTATWVSIDVTSLVKGEGLTSLALTIQDAASLVFYSRESGNNAPQLVIVTGP